MTKLWLPLLLLVHLTASARDGYHVGNGGDDIQPIDGAAWFPSGRTIRACIESESNFEFSRTELQTLIEGSFQGWIQYLKSKMYLPPIATRLEVAANCSEADLTFYFGIDSRRLRQLRAKYFHPTAFAERISHDQNGWSRGLVWVKTQDLPWTSDRLFGILTHELGHILGCDHVPGTIMQAEIHRWLFTEGRSSFEFHRIDQAREILYCAPCGFTYVGNRRPPNRSVFELFVGRPAQGAVRAKLASPARSRRPILFQLTYADDKGETTFDIPLTLSMDMSAVQSVFKTLLILDPSPPSLPLRAGALWNVSGSEYGVLTTAAGEKIALTFEYNRIHAGVNQNFFSDTHTGVWSAYYLQNPNRTAEGTLRQIAFTADPIQPEN